MVNGKWITFLSENKQQDGIRNSHEQRQLRRFTAKYWTLQFFNMYPIIHVDEILSEKGCALATVDNMITPEI